MSSFDIYVPGTVRGQGSMKAVTAKFQKYADTTVAWRNTLVDRFLSEKENYPDMPWQGDVVVRLLAVMERPQSHYVSGKREKGLKKDAPVRCAKAPDIDKIARCCLDALTIAGIVQDDKLVTQLVVSKLFSTEEMSPGLVVSVRTL